MDTTSLATGLALVASVLCAGAAMRASRLIASGLWLAGSSALLATALYFLDAPYVAVIELSVGPGPVAVLFVFAVMTAGDDGMRAAPGVSRWFAVGLTGLHSRYLAWRFSRVSSPPPGLRRETSHRSSGNSAVWTCWARLCSCSSPLWASSR